MMRHHSHDIAIVALVAGTAGAGLLSAVHCADARPRESGDTWYATEIAPIFEASCIGCHGEKRQRSGLALHTPEAIATGADGGPVAPVRSARVHSRP